MVYRHAARIVQSPLLSMPSQLRILILKLVLGGQMIHVHARPKRLEISICRAHPSDSEASRCFALADQQILPLHYQHRHAKCWTSHRELHALQASLKLLLVCRQLHDEAALLPFSANDFAFDGTNGDGHEMFVASLGAVQQRAVRHIVLGPQLFYRQSPFNILEKLCNVQEIGLFLTDDICESITGDEVSGEKVTWLEEQFRGVQCRSLRNLGVIISSERCDKKLPKAVALGVAREVEGHMLERLDVVYQSPMHSFPKQNSGETLSSSPVGLQDAQENDEVFCPSHCSSDANARTVEISIPRYPVSRPSAVSDLCGPAQRKKPRVMYGVWRIQPVGRKWNLSRRHFASGSICGFLLYFCQAV